MLDEGYIVGSGVIVPLPLPLYPDASSPEDTEESALFAGLLSACIFTREEKGLAFNQ